MVSKASRRCVTGYPPERLGSFRQEMKGKMVVKRVLLMTHQETWHTARQPGARSSACSDLGCVEVQTL